MAHPIPMAAYIWRVKSGQEAAKTDLTIVFAAIAEAALCHTQDLAHELVGRTSKLTTSNRHPRDT